jgi:hypothetical protein
MQYEAKRKYEFVSNIYIYTYIVQHWHVKIHRPDTAVVGTG